MDSLNFQKIVKRAGELAVASIDTLRSISPSAVGDSQSQGIQAAKFTERSNASRKELRQEYIDEILTEEFGHLVIDADED
jgi:hypothetical protein